jgi:hypothetical protein
MSSSGQNTADYAEQTAHTCGSKAAHAQNPADRVSLLTRFLQFEEARLFFRPE